jgi:hypothetical protein
MKSFDITLTLRVWAGTEKDAESIAVNFLGLKGLRAIPPMIVDLKTNELVPED